MEIEIVLPAERKHVHVTECAASRRNFEWRISFWLCNAAKQLKIATSTSVKKQLNCRVVARILPRVSFNQRVDSLTKSEVDRVAARLLPSIESLFHAFFKVVELDSTSNASRYQKMNQIRSLEQKSCSYFICIM